MTVIEFEVPVMVLKSVSVTVTVWTPTVLNVNGINGEPEQETERVQSGGNVAWGSLLVKCTVPPYRTGPSLAFSGIIDVKIEVTEPAGTWIPSGKTFTAKCVMVSGTPISQMPRPWVAARSTRCRFWMARSKIATRGRPVL